VVRDHNGQQLAYIYFENEPGRRSAAKLLTRDEARRTAVNIVKLLRGRCRPPIPREVVDPRCSTTDRGRHRQHTGATEKGVKPLPSGMTGAICGSIMLRSRAALLPTGRLPGTAGCMKSSMTASGSWLGAMAPAAASSPGTAMTSQRGFRSSLLRSLPGRSFLIDGEAIVTNRDGLAVFDLIRRRRHGDDAVLIAFDLIELDGEDLRRSPIEYRKSKLTKLVRSPHPGIVLNEHYEGNGEIVFAHAWELGCEGIVSKRLGSPYRSGRSPHWLKIKNPAVPAVKREVEEDWGR
jgi:ATP dependent DNA ligase domain